jgi:hypothetical protein
MIFPDALNGGLGKHYKIGSGGTALSNKPVRAPKVAGNIPPLTIHLRQSDPHMSPSFFAVTALPNHTAVERIGQRDPI